MKLWKRNLIAAAIPIAAITVGCVAAQDDMDALAIDDMTNSALRFSEAPVMRLKIIEIGPGSVFSDDEAERAAERAEQWVEHILGGAFRYEDAILSALTHERIAVAFDVDKEGTSDPCQVTIAKGSEAVAEQTVTLRGYHTNAPEELFVMEQRESEEACEDGSGFFFDETEAGAHGAIALCPSSCDTFASAAAEGVAIGLEMVIGES